MCQDAFDEIMAERSPNLRRVKDIQVQEEQRVPSRMKPKRPTQRHIIIKLLRTENTHKKILKAVREK